MEIGHDDIEDHIAFYVHRQQLPETPPAFLPSATLSQSEDRVTLSLLTNRGTVAEKSHLNWGQRRNRNRDEAYIHIPVEHRRPGIFPPRRVPFTVRTDDEVTMIMVRQQDEGKAISTTDGNYILGEYFRRRMRVPLGKKIRMEDFQRYGRIDVEFVKLDDETYLMDFSIQD